MIDKSIGREDKTPIKKKIFQSFKSKRSLNTKRKTIEGIGYVDSY